MSAVEPRTNIDFMAMRHACFLLSFVCLLICIYSWFSSGSAKFGIDFVGGTDVVVKFDDTGINLAKVRQSLNGSGLSSVSVQEFERGSNEFSIRVKGLEVGDVSASIKKALGSISSKFEILRVDYVGPIIGEKIKVDGFKSIAFAIFVLLAYISWRFEFRYAVGAVLALTHDVIMAAGVFILFGGEIGASALAALLTILGYSVNDTIIVYDRVRENMLLSLSKGGESRIGSLSLKKMTPKDIINLSINQTLSRTILTSGTTLFTCLTLWLYGGGAISDLAFILTVGILTGTYSSIFIAAPLILSMSRQVRQVKS
ncbi:MAG TPA: protein translocase subunit SecF [Oligoflexia bacterium]|nr:protein translocase subunit SecF [Oligoflexia bacterium]HMP49826.1 protein translocase subunit SecF [Oligoflexia bacterium]